VSDGCRERWQLFAEVERQQYLARLDHIPDEEYIGFRDAMDRYRSHFRACELCKAWLGEWIAIGERNYENKSE